MKCDIVFSSKTGNTQILAKDIYIILVEKNDVKIAKLNKEEEFRQDADVYFVGFWTDKGTCDELSKELLQTMKNKKIVLFGTMGMGNSPEYIETIVENVKKNIDSSNEVISYFMCQGKMPDTVKEKYEEALQEKEDPYIRSMLNSFEGAMDHPDEEDLSDVRDWVRSLNIG